MPFSDSHLSLSQALKEAIDLQRRLQEGEFNEMMGSPLRDRIDRGHTIANVSLRFSFYAYAPNQYCREYRDEKYISRALVKCPGNISKLRAGSKVLLSNRGCKFTMVISEDRIDTMTLVPDDFDLKNCHISPLDYPRDGWEINETNTQVTAGMLMTAASRLEHESYLGLLMEELLGGTLSEEGRRVPLPPSGNPSQDEAVGRSLGCRHFHLIQGPPGTGKTYTIALIVKRLLEEGKNVLITGPTHTAINNCLLAIARVLPDPEGKIVKVGDKYQGAEIPEDAPIVRKVKFPHGSYAINRSLSHEGIAVGATPYGVCYPSTKRMEGWTFDVAIIDEASQLSIPLSLPPLTVSDRVILVGDHKQLDPIMPHGSGNFLFEKSIFKHLVDLYPDNCTMLDLSYRLSPSLVRIPTLLSYGSRLRSALPADNKCFTSFEEVAEYSYLVTSPTNEVLFLHHVFDAMSRSPFEAKVTAQIVSTLLGSGVPLGEIALITPFRAQVREIKRQLVLGNVIAEDEIDSVFVDTIERMQGQERDYVVLSYAISNPEDTSSHLDFVYSPNRLNVAITRARIKCWVLSNAKLFDLDSECASSDDRVREGMEAFRLFRKNATVIEDRASSVLSDDEEW